MVTIISSNGRRHHILTVFNMPSLIVFAVFSTLDTSNVGTLGKVEHPH